MDNINRFDLQQLYQIILDRIKLKPTQENLAKSYTLRLLSKGEGYICRKMIEEALEVTLESHDTNRENLVYELSDLFYHTLVLAAFHNIKLADIEKECQKRHSLENKSDPSVNLSSLEGFQYPWPFTTADMFSKCGLTSKDSEDLIKSSDVIFFSHNFRKTTFSGVRVVNAFPLVTKEFKNLLQTEGYKPKFGLPNKVMPSFRSPRAEQEWIIPIVVITNIIVLPLFVHILAAYVKEFIDTLSEHKVDREQNIEFDICIHEANAQKESWYKIKGKSKQVVSILDTIQKSLTKQ